MMVRLTPATHLPSVAPRGSELGCADLRPPQAGQDRLQLVVTTLKRERESKCASQPRRAIERSQREVTMESLTYGIPEAEITMPGDSPLRSLGAHYCPGQRFAEAMTAI